MAVWFVIVVVLTRLRDMMNAKLQIGDVSMEQDVAPTDTHIRFEVDLKAGDYDLETWLTVGQKTRGALFVYVSAK